MMNCEKAKPLIPLFVGADLDAVEMQQVANHLEACAACRELVSEFQASQSSLRATTAPAFDEAMLAAMRGVVMQGVAPTVTRPVFMEWLQPIWTWKLALAAAALLVLVSGTVISRRGAEPLAVQVQSNAKEAPANSLALHSTRKAPATNSRLAPQRLQPRMGRKKIAQGEVSEVERNPGNNTQRQPSPARATDVNNQIAAASIAPFGANDPIAIPPRVDTLGFILPPAPQAENATSSLEKSTPEPEMLRMEFQTADPNIRIIWLTPKEPTRTSRAADTK